VTLRAEPYNAALDLIDRNLRAGRAHKTAFVDDAGSYTYGELAERVDRCANALRELGIERGQRLILGLLDGIAFPTAFLGAIEAGIVPVPVNTLFSIADYAFVLQQSGAVAAIVSQPLLAAYREAAASVGWTARFIVSGGTDADVLQLDELLAAARPQRVTVATHADETCFWLYSSGSTGKPKGTLHRHASLMHTAELFASRVLDMRDGDIVYSAAKLFFAYGLGNALTFPLSVGATSVLCAGRPNVQTVVDVLRSRGATIFCGVPTLYTSLLASGAVPERGAHALRICTSAGEALPQHIGEAWRERTGVDIIDGIGSTEMLHIFVSTRPGAVTYGVTGTPVPGYETRLVDERNDDVAAGDLGELLVRGPSAFVSYWNEPERTAAAFVGDWVRTGDKFYQTPAGDYVHCGRTDDMIKAGGIWVSPSEVEATLAGHDAVLEAAVIGVPDENELVKPKAFVVLQNGYRANEALAHELQRYVKARLAAYKYPRWIAFVDELPKTATGKIQRHVLRRSEAARAERHV